MATYSNVPAVSGSVSATYTFGGSGSSTLYTCPANSYAVINVYVSGDMRIEVAGCRVWDTTMSDDYVTSVYVGPSQAVVAITSTGGSAAISGAQFTNQA